MSEREIFEQALQKQGLDRQAYLNQACGQDVALRGRLDELLAAHDGAGSFLGAPAVQGERTLDMPSVVEDAGSVVGPYKLLQRIGEGGFGVVYMAEQTEPVRRKVALKIIKPGMDTKEVIARFESERQALALMDHPNIARVLDAGATRNGRPYFVMELVKGVPITEFCDKNNLAVNERLALFVRVCLAVQHAHHKGIIHRDLKPSNVMVTLHDGQPVPKVIDFGVAKATSQQLTQRTLFTAYGQMIGTPLYMSPEQAEMSGLDIDTRSDIYSLGVLLYELLTGTTPLEMKQLREAGFAEMQRLIREVDAPRPSMRLSTMKHEASIICGKRGTDLKQLCELLKGDIDWIVMKALEKDRQRRYDSPNALAEDIGRYLGHEAILARPPSTTYRVRKFVQRHKGLAAGLGAVVAALLLGAVISTTFALYARWQWTRATEAERRLQFSLAEAQQERQKAVEERDRAVKAEEAQAKLTQLAEQRRTETEESRKAEAEQRAAAEQQRDAAERLKQEAIVRSTQLQQLTEEQRRTIYASDMNLVRIEAQRGNLQRMREILMEQLPIHGEEDLRGFEWNYWYRFLNQAQVLLRLEKFQYGAPGSAAAIVPGGELVAVTQGDRTEIRELATGRTLATHPIQLRGLVDRTRFSATGRLVHGTSNSMLAYQTSSSGRDRGKGTECTVYEPTGGKHSFTYPPESFSHVSFLNISHDGRFVVALGNDIAHQRDKPACRLLVWNVDSGELVLNQVQPRELNRVEFSPDGSLLAAYLCHGTNRKSDDFRDVMVVIDIASGQERGVAQHNDDLDSVYWLSDQRRLLLATLSYSGANRKELLSWTIGEARPQRLSQETMPNYVKGAVSPDGRWLAVSGHTVSNIRLIDTERGQVVRTLHNEATNIDSLTFSPDGQRVVACSTTGEVLSWSLSQNADLFALQANPLPELVDDGFAISPDQSLLAVVHTDGAVVIRNREGDETILRPGIPSATGGTSQLKFSSDNRYLVHQSNVGADGKRLTRTTVADGRRSTTSQGTLLELYDLPAAKRVWQVVQAGVPNVGAAMEFSSDQRHLALAGGIVVNCETGDAERRGFETGSAIERVMKGGSARESLSNGAGLFRLSRELVRIPSTGQVVMGASGSAGRDLNDPNAARAILLIDAFSGELLHRAESPVVAPADVASIKPSPDGIHVGLQRLGRDGPLEIWNLPESQRVFSAPGTKLVFSPDGKLAAIAKSEFLTQVGSGRISAISEIAVWDIALRRRLCLISLAGNRADEFRFSPDGQRLLTLHGKRSLGSGGTVAQCRLWSVDSGREILAIPVADVNVYNWELVFDSTGNRLTTLLLGKASGTRGGGRSDIFDASPLSPQEDAQLIARRLIEDLGRETPLPSEMVAAIEARSGLKPLVRETTLAAISSMRYDAARVAQACLENIANRNLSSDEYRKALRWAESLRVVEPDSVRSRSLLAAAQYRCGLVQEALATLADNRRKSPSAETQDPEPYEVLGMCVELLAIHQSGDTSRMTELRRKIPATFTAFTVKDSDVLLMERRNVLEFWSETRVVTGAAFPDFYSSAQVEAWFKELDRDGSGQLNEQDLTQPNERDRWSLYRPFDVDRSGGLSLAEYQTAVKAWALVNPTRRQDIPPSETAKLANFDEAVRLAPQYAPALNARAWLLSTTRDDQLRNGARAVIDATRACELTEWKSATYLDTLAAAHAAAGDFEQAVRRQEEALSLHELNGYLRARPRLRLYETRSDFRASAASVAESERSLPANGVSSPTPLLTQDEISKSRRFEGAGGVSWSPDGKRLVRSRLANGLRDSALELVEIESGAATLLVRNGVRPSWSPRPDGPIVFLRVAEGQPVRLANQEIWLVNSDGSNPRKLGLGGSMSWSRDGRLFSYSLTDRGRLQFRSITLDDTENNWRPLAEVEGVPIVSRDGTLMAYTVLGRLIVRRVDGSEEVLSLPLGPEEYGFLDWSPEGRELVYCSVSGAARGVWLIDVATGEKKLLAKLLAGRAHWSPDGRQIAVEEPSQKGQEIVLLDVSSLRRSGGSTGAPASVPATAAPPVAPKGSNAAAERPQP